VELDTGGFSKSADTWGRTREGKWGGVGRACHVAEGEREKEGGGVAQGQLSDRGALSGVVRAGSTHWRQRRPGEQGRAAGRGRRGAADWWGRAATGPGVCGGVQEGEG
jgi:hypothetical protein